MGKIILIIIYIILWIVAYKKYQWLHIDESPFLTIWTSIHLAIIIILSILFIVYFWDYGL